MAKIPGSSVDVYFGFNPDGTPREELPDWREDPEPDDDAPDPDTLSDFTIAALGIDPSVFDEEESGDSAV